LCYPVAAEASCGTLNADKKTATLGEKVTLTLDPQSESYRLASLSVRCGGENIETEKVSESVYTFTMPAGSVSASAVFVTDYFVSFENTDGAILAWQDLVSGQTPVYSGQTPEREPSVTSVFTFSGWDRPLEPVSGDEPFIKYTATYAPSPRSYEARFLGSKGETLQSATVKYGETPVYSGETPLKDADENYAYAFEKWSPEVSSATQDAVYTPVFRAFPLLREGINTFELEAYEQLDCLFTAEESGYYRFFTSGDDVGPEFIVTDGDKNDVSVKHFYVERGEQMSCERLVQLEEGETYAVSLTGYRAGEVSLHIRSVSVHTVRLDPNTPNGKVCGNEDVSFTAYSGELLTPYAEPDDGYGLFEMTVTDENGRRLMADRGSYLMPESDLFVTASFAPAREIKNDMNYGVSFINNDAVFADWSEEEETFVYRAAAGVGVEYKLLWEEGYIPDEIAVKTQSGENVPFGTFLYGASETDLWFTMPDEPVTVTAKAAEASVLTLHSGLSDGGVARYAVKTGKEAALPACPFASPDGKAFSGWAETENGEPVYADKGAFTANADSALYAVWNDAPYIKTALSDGDTGKLCEITLYNMQSGVTLVLAEYENGRLLSARTRQTADAAEVFSLSASADKVKAFALEAVASAPLTGAVEVTVN
ncbi:MAG: hypothetical protein IJS65_00510, partial [Clostridia bacterium]|nr:hypothetical protein [Clostridia bacterium]